MQQDVPSVGRKGPDRFYVYPDQPPASADWRGRRPYPLGRWSRTRRLRARLFENQMGDITIEERRESKFDPADFPADDVLRDVTVSPNGDVILRGRWLHVGAPQWLAPSCRRAAASSRCLPAGDRGDHRRAPAPPTHNGAGVLHDDGILLSFLHDAVRYGLARGTCRPKRPRSSHSASALAHCVTRTSVSPGQ